MKNQDLQCTVTGGAGFIGSALVESLLSDGFRVICADNFATGKHSNIAPFLKNPDFVLAEGDICDFEFAKKICTGSQFVFHEAALGSVPRSIQTPQETLRVNVSGTAAVFKAAAESGVKRLIYASSSSVYGDSQILPKQENVIGTQLSPYALSKYVDELLAAQFSKLYGLQCIGLRYFNVFGPRQDPQSEYAAVIPKFVQALLQKKSPVIYGDGGTTRDFTYVKDVVSANRKAMTADNAALGGVFNIASEHEISLNRLFRELQKCLAEDMPIILSVQPQYAPSRPGDVARSLADISCARKYLGYTPEFSFENAIKETCAWYKNNFCKQ